MTFVVDIDNTLTMHDGDVPRQEEIDALNVLYDAGHTVVLWTSRSWFDYARTKEQMKRHGVKHHELYMGKPFGTYVDRDALLSLATRRVPQI